jgi:hypothetical protein
MWLVAHVEINSDRAEPVPDRIIESGDDRAERWVVTDA